MQNLNDLINPFLKIAYLISQKMFYLPSTIQVYMGLFKIFLEWQVCHLNNLLY